MVYNQNSGNNFRSSLATSMSTFGDLQFYIYTVLCCIVISYVIFYVLRKSEYEWVYGPKLDALAKWLPGIHQKKSTDASPATAS